MRFFAYSGCCFQFGSCHARKCFGYIQTDIFVHLPELSCKNRLNADMAELHFYVGCSKRNRASIVMSFQGFHDKMGKFSFEIGRRIASLAWGKKYDADLFSNVCEKLKRRYSNAHLDPAAEAYSFRLLMLQASSTNAASGVASGPFLHPDTALALLPEASKSITLIVFGTIVSNSKNSCSYTWERQQKRQAMAIGFARRAVCCSRGTLVKEAVGNVTMMKWRPEAGAIETG